jgi:hypothetical protein
MTTPSKRPAQLRSFRALLSGAFRHRAPDLFDARHLSDHLKRDLGLLDWRHGAGGARSNRRG